MIRLHIELQRVQSWLFAVPRLRAMVGANALLGEALRVDLPNLARETGRGWVLATSTHPYPDADLNDPLKEHDDPAADARDGILSRDGGHFEAQFTAGAAEFANAAAQLLHTALPGLRFRVSIDRVELEKQQRQTHLSTELPVLMPCEWTGRGLASQTITQGDEHPAVSLDVAHRHEAAGRVENNTARDLASLLTSTTKISQLTRPQELKELVGNGYLALIHADGNGVGGGASEDEVERAAFFHRNRVLLRRAVHRAIQTHSPDQGRSTLIPLMLGGDDLLLVCRAEVALPFVVTLCDALAGFQKEAAGFKLTLGVGVVIAKHTIPIHQLHEVAEQLAGSANRRFRGLQKSEAGTSSVVDWAVYNTAWVDNPEEVRRRDWLRVSDPNRRVLSQRPLNVLGDGLNTLAGLLRGAQELANAPRSQLRYLVEQLPRGQALSELAFAELSKEAKDALGRAGVVTAWGHAPDGSAWLTPLLDLVEVVETARLGGTLIDQDNADQKSQGEVIHG